VSEGRFSPRVEYWESRARESFARQGAMATIGARMIELTPGRCTLAADFRPDLAQQHGYFHAGITSALADSAGGYAAYTLFAENSEVLTVEFKINLIAPARGTELIAEARVVQPGRTLTVCTIDVRCVGRGADVTCAIVQQTLIRVDAASNG
jgi:uncharacterized protein (TIGR00369 family)